MKSLFVATGESVARLEWQADGEWRAYLSLEGAGAQCLAIDPLTHTTLYAGCRGGGVWKSADAGATWNRLALPQNDVFSMAISPADGSVYAGCEPSMLFRSRDAGATWTELESLRSIPSAPTWSFPPRPWTSHVRWIAPNPQNPDVILVGIELGGLMYSEDGGREWRDHRPGAQKDVHCLAWHPRAAGRAYEAGGGGAAWSHDSGMSWEPADAGRDRHYTWAAAVHPEDPDCWFISANPGPMQAHHGGSAEAFIYRWRAGGPWEALRGGLPQPLDAMPYALAIRAGEIYAGLSNGQLYFSPDDGDSWAPQTISGDALPSIVALVTG